MERGHGDVGVRLQRELVARIRALSRAQLEAIAAYAADTGDEYERNPHLDPLAALLEATEPYLGELRRSPVLRGPSTGTDPYFDQCSLLSGGLRCVRPPGHAGRCDFD